MAITQARPATRRHGRAAVQLRLDVAEWLALHDVLVAASPEVHTPSAFARDALPPTSAVEHAGAWASLVARGLATEVATRDVAALTPAVAVGLRALLQSPLRVDVMSRTDQGDVHRSIAWSDGRTVSLACHRPSGAARAQQPWLELTLAADDAGHEVRKDLPGRDGGLGAAVGATPVRIGWRGAAATAAAVRAGREDVADLLSGLPAEALALVGSESTTVVGSMTITIHRDDAAPGLAGAWLWTATDVVELLDATEQTVALRRTTVARLCNELLTTVTGLDHSHEFL